MCQCYIDSATTFSDNYIIYGSIMNYFSLSYDTHDSIPQMNVARAAQERAIESKDSLKSGSDSQSVDYHPSAMTNCEC